MNLKSKSHVFIKHFVIMNNFQNLFFVIANFKSQIFMLQKRVLSVQFVAVSWIWEQDSHLFRKGF